MGGSLSMYILGCCTHALQRSATGRGKWKTTSFKAVATVDGRNSAPVDNMVDSLSHVYRFFYIRGVFFTGFLNQQQYVLLVYHDLMRINGYKRWVCNMVNSSKPVNLRSIPLSLFEIYNFSTACHVALHGFPKAHQDSRIEQNDRFDLSTGLFFFFGRFTKQKEISETMQSGWCVSGWCSHEHFRWEHFPVLNNKRRVATGLGVEHLSRQCLSA